MRKRRGGVLVTPGAQLQIQQNQDEKCQSEDRQYMKQPPYDHLLNSLIRF